MRGSIGKTMRNVEGIEPAEVIADDDIRAGARNALPAADSKLESKAQSRNGDEAHESVGRRRPPSHRKQIRGRNGGLNLAIAGYFGGGTETDCHPPLIDLHMGHRHHPGRVQHAPPVIAHEVRARAVRRVWVGHPQDAAWLDGLHGGCGMALELGAIPREELDHVGRTIPLFGGRRVLWERPQPVHVTCRRIHEQHLVAGLDEQLAGKGGALHGGIIAADRGIGGVAPGVPGSR